MRTVFRRRARTYGDGQIGARTGTEPLVGTRERIRYLRGQRCGFDTRTQAGRSRGRRILCTRFERRELRARARVARENEVVESPRS